MFECLTLEVETEARNLPTDERIRRVKEGEEDPDLIALYFNYGRYLLIASSIRGELPANLQGKWNDQINPPWDSDYHFDINLQMNYWMVEKGNMSECAEALLNLFLMLKRQLGSSMDVEAFIYLSKQMLGEGQHQKLMDGQYGLVQHLGLPNIFGGIIFTQVTKLF